MLGRHIYILDPVPQRNWGPGAKMASNSRRSQVRADKGPIKDLACACTGLKLPPPPPLQVNYRNYRGTSTKRKMRGRSASAYNGDVRHAHQNTPIGTVLGDKP
jgi:hypothetical protein